MIGAFGCCETSLICESNAVQFLRCSLRAPLRTSFTCRGKALDVFQKGRHAKGTHTKRSAWLRNAMWNVGDFHRCIKSSEVRSSQKKRTWTLDEFGYYLQYIKIDLQGLRRGEWRPFIAFSSHDEEDTGWGLEWFSTICLVIPFFGFSVLWINHSGVGQAL